MDQSSGLQVLDVKQASDVVQALEARGDFKYKGIARLYTIITNWTDRFDSNGILPTLEQLCRESELPEDKVKAYLREMTGRGSTNSPVIVAMPSLQFVPGSDSRIENMTVYCRPGQREGGNAQRYYAAFVDKNTKALTRWLQVRPAPKADVTRNLLNQAIREGRLRDTRARTEVARLFLNEMDQTAEERRLNNVLHVRPVLKRLIDTKQMLLLNGQTPDGQDFNGVFFNQGTELEDRFNVIAEYFTRNVSAGGGDASDPEAVRTQLDAVDAGRYASLNESQKQVVQELLLLTPVVIKNRKAAVEKTREEALTKVVEELLKHPRPVEASALKSVEAEDAAHMRSIKGILHADYALGGRIREFYLHKDNVAQAIDHARQLFDTDGNDVEVRILSAMGLERHLDTDRYRAFLDLEQRTLFSYLGFFKRLWRMLTGNRKLSEKEVVQLKREAQKEQEQERARVRKTEARKAQKELVSKRMKGADEGGESEGAGEGGSRAGGDHVNAPEPPSSEEKAAQDQSREEARETLKQIVDILDEAWKNRLLPNRTYLVERMKGFDEDQLIMFLKKYGRKEVLSFQIKHDRPEYVWPILISRRYLRRFGKSLLGRVSDEADAQRKAQMPDQHKFDVANSIEEFLNRVLPGLG